MSVIPNVRFVFDRRKVATTKRAHSPKTGDVQIEVYYQRERKWFSTGIRVYADEWEPGYKPIKNRPDAAYINERLVAMVQKVEAMVAKLEKTVDGFNWKDFLRMMKGDFNKETFIEYVARRLEERPDIGCGTRKNHRKLVNSLLEFGEIETFSSLTRANIIKYYEWLQRRGLKQTTVCSYMKFLRVYIHDAMAFELLDRDPSVAIKIAHGRSEDDRWLTEDELEILKKAELPEPLERVRDLFLVQCYSGLAYGDLENVSAESVKEIDGVPMITGRRHKTGVLFATPIVPELKALLEKYHYHLPMMTNEQYNMRLKLVAVSARIKKPLASHWGRRTCGYMMARKGYSIEVIARVLGHSNIRTTQEVYAKYLPDSVVREFKRIEISPAV